MLSKTCCNLGRVCTLAKNWTLLTICCPPIGNRLSLASHNTQNSAPPRPHPLKVPARILHHHPKEYAVHDTHMALVEARNLGITPFCLTVDKAGHDYLKSMCGDMGYEVLGEIWSLPERLPMLYPSSRRGGSPGGRTGFAPGTRKLARKGAPR